MRMPNCGEVQSAHTPRLRAGHPVGPAAWMPAFVGDREFVVGGLP
jgi:hypothetical protein